MPLCGARRAAKVGHPVPRAASPPVRLVPSTRSPRPAPLAALLLLLGLTAAACDRTDAPAADSTATPALTFETGGVRLLTRRDTIPMRVELAVSPEQKQLGLMERRSLPPNGGMLFVYDSTQPPTAAFWMYRTRIPLDIAYIDSAGVIGSIVRMEPCTSDLEATACPTYPANVPFLWALEVPAGWFAQKGVAVGDRVVRE